ncbi:MAG TPA: hypothetical protein VKI61_09975, partial [Chitinophagaceae bacterium]|nr:hypothetical protein [Chitinophagaceae bacterium]
MRIGIFLDNWGKLAGGGHSYAKTVIEYFSSVISNHEFIFIVNTTKNDLPEDYNSISNFLLYNPFIRTNNEDEQKRKEVKSLGRLLKTFDFFIDKLGLTSFILFRDKLKGKIESYNHEQRKDPAIFKELIRDQNIQCVYYPTAFTCEDYDIPFYATIWDLGHLTISVFPEVSSNGQFESRQKLLNAIIPRSYRIVSESESGKSDISRYYNIKPEKIVIVPQFPSNLVHLKLSVLEMDNILEKFHLHSKIYLFYPAQFWPH